MALIEPRGKPGSIVSDNGTELTSNAILKWCAATKIEWYFIARGKPMQNGFVTSFNGQMRDAFPNQTLSRNLVRARERIAAWVTDDTTERPHSALGYQNPAGSALHLTTAIAHADRRKRAKGPSCGWKKTSGRSDFKRRFLSFLSQFSVKFSTCKFSFTLTPS